MGRAAFATRTPNRSATPAGSSARLVQRSSPASTRSMKPWASSATSGVGPAEPMPVPTRRRTGSSSSAKEATAITIALRVPTLANCCGPLAVGAQKAAISSSDLNTLRLGPTQNARTGTRLEPLVDTISTSASAASSGGRASPAGEAVPRLPPTVPRLRICGEPTVRDAMARPGRRSPSSLMIRVYVTPAPTRSQPSTWAHSERSGTLVRSSNASGRRRSKLSSTMTSVPPRMGRASGRSAFMARASCHVVGCRKSTSAHGGSAPHRGLDQPVGPVRGVEDLVVVRQAKRGQVDGKVVLVRHLQAYLGDLRSRLQHRGGHLVEGLLQRQAALLQRERFQQGLPGLSEALGPLYVQPGEAPSGIYGRRQDAVTGFFQRGVAISGEASELGARRPEHYQVSQARDCCG